MGQNLSLFSLECDFCFCCPFCELCVLFKYYVTLNIRSSSYLSSEGCEFWSSESCYSSGSFNGCNGSKKANSNLSPGDNYSRIINFEICVCLFSSELCFIELLECGTWLFCSPDPPRDFDCERTLSSVQLWHCPGCYELLWNCFESDTG